MRQNEDHTYWQAPEVYYQMSPFSYADEIRTPLLLIHGQADNNSGTFPIQSERCLAPSKPRAALCVLYCCLWNRTVIPRASRFYTCSGR
jgi:hypothetical protein